MPRVNDEERLELLIILGLQLFGHPAEGAASLLPAAMDNGVFMD